MKTQTLHYSLIIAAVGFVACGGDDEEERPVIIPPSLGYMYSADAPCTSSVPVPNDLFVADDLLNEASECDGPSDPADAAIYQVTQHEGASLNAEISIPVVNATIDIASVVNTASFSLTSSVGTSSTSDSIPPLVFIGRSSSSTRAEDWFEVEHDALVETDRLVVIPREPLKPATYYVLAATDEIRTSDKKEIEAASVTTQLLGSSPIVAAGNIDAETAKKLERERLRLQEAVSLLGNAYPPVTSDRIRSIQGWRTTLGPQKLASIVQEYRDALQRGRFPFKVTTSGGDLDSSDFLPAGSPTSNINNFRQGTITVPKLLNDQGRIRANWASSDAQFIEIPFLISVPKTSRSSYPVSIYLPGFGRSKQDASLLANEFGGGSQSAVLGLDLKYYGDRSLDTSDTQPNNENPTVSGADGIPDSSGTGIYSGSPGVLRDEMIATIIEVAHVIETLKDEAAFEAEMISPDGNISKLHMIAHGQSANIGLHAALVSRVGTIQLPSGGSDFEHLLVDGPTANLSHFLMDAPTGINETNVADYITKLKSSVLLGLTVEDASEKIYDAYVDRSSPKILLQHPSDAEFVSTRARESLIESLELPSKRVSAHGGTFCDDFFLYTCALGENSAIVSRAQEQLTSFVSSGGVTVKSPAL